MTFIYESYYFFHLKLEIALAIPALNERKILVNKQHKATAPPAPQNSVNVAPLREARRVKILFFYADYAWRVFLRHVTIVTGHRATPKKCGAVKDKLFPAFFLRRGAAQRSAA